MIKTIYPLDCIGGPGDISEAAIFLTTGISLEPQRILERWAIERHAQSFFVQALQLDVKIPRLEAKQIKPARGVLGFE